MDIIELGAIGELVGGVAVIASLLFVGFQVRQGNRLARSQAHQYSAQMSTELGRSFDRETLGLFDQAVSNPGGMAQLDLRFVRARFIAGVNYYETLFYAFERGDVEPDLWESRRFRMANFIRPAKDQLWAPTKAGFGKRFRDFVDFDLLPNTPVTASPVVFGEDAMATSADPDKRE